MAAFTLAAKLPDTITPAANNAQTAPGARGHIGVQPSEV